MASKEHVAHWFLEIRSAVVVTIVGLLLTLIFFLWVRDYHERESQKAFDDEALHLTNEVIDRFHNIEQELYALGAMTAATRNLTHSQFKGFLEGMESVALRKSVRGYGLLQRVARADILTFVAEQQAHYPEYHFHQFSAHNNPYYYPVQFIEPLGNNRAALGLDIGSEPTRMQALQQAIDIGRPVLTQLITLAQGHQDAQGFLLFLPVYHHDVRKASVEQRRDALLAVVDAAIIAEELMQDVTHVTKELLDFELYSQSNDQPPSLRLVFDADKHLLVNPSPTAGPVNDLSDRKHVKTGTFMIAGQTFVLTISSTAAFETRHKSLTGVLVVITGILLTLLLTNLVTANARARARAEALATRMTTELKRLAIVAERTANSVFFTSPEFHITWVNQGFETVTGYSRQEAQGRTLRELLLCEQTAPEEIERLEKAMHESKPYRGEIISKRRTGERYWGLLQFQPIFDDAGTMTGYMGFETDINELKLAEDNLRKSRDQFRSLVDNIPGATYRCMLDKYWTMIYLSDQIEPLCGYPSKDFLLNAKRSYASIVLSEDRGWVEREIFAAIDRNEAWDIEYRIVRADGEIRWVRERGSLSGENPGVVKFMDGFILDITYQKQAFVQVARQQQMLEGMSKLGRIGAWEYDVTKQRMHWSAMTKTIHDVATDFEPTLSAFIHFFKAGDDQRAISQAIDSALKQGTPWYLELMLVTRKGHETWVAVTGQAHQRDGECVRLFGSFQDIDQRKRDELTHEKTAALNQAVAAMHVHPAVQAGEFMPAMQVFCESACAALSTRRASVWLFTEDRTAIECIALFDSVSLVCTWGETLLCSDYPEYFDLIAKHAQLAVKDTQAHPATLRMQRNYLQLYDIQAMLDVAITSGDGIVGIVCAENTGSTRQWSNAEIAFLMSLATLAGNVYATEQKRRAQAALALSEERLRGLFDLSPIGIALNDFETGKFIDVNKALYAPTGYSKQEFMALSYWDLTPLQYEADEAVQLQRLKDTGKYGPYEKEYIRKDGSSYPVRLNGTLVHDRAGQRLIWSMVEDISERKAQDTTLKQLLTQLENFFELSINFMSIINTEWKFEKINHAFERVLGYQESDLLKHSLLNIVHPDDIENTRNELLNITQGRGAFTFQNRVRNKAGGYINLQWYSAADLESGKLYASAVDVTAQQDTLQALINAKNAAESADRMKSEFLATMSHEIRTPMNGVLGMLGLLLRTPLNDEQKHRMEIAQSSARSLLAIINDILDFSKVEAGKLDIEQVDFDLQALLEDITDAFRYKAVEKGLDLRFVGDALNPKLVKGDPGRLRQVLTNLFSNALKFTDQGAITLHCTLIPSGNHLQLKASVEDTGIGIDPEKIPELFSAFTQADASTTRKYGGTGLGLAICKKLCQLMGGDISASSKKGQGSCFEFSVQLAVSHPVETDVKTPNLSGENSTVSPPPWSSNTRVLVVEDNPVNQEVTLALLKDLGLMADLAHNGLEAIGTLRSTTDANAYALILMDCQMPNMDGFEATRHIRSGRGGKRYQHIPVIALTANAMPSDQIRCQEAGMNDYLSKPIEAAQLETLLRKWLGGPVTQLTAPTIAQRLARPPMEAFDTPASTTHSVWDSEALLQSIGGRKELAVTLLNLFIERSPQQLEILRHAVAEKDTATIELLAHTIKGSAAQLRASQLSGFAAEIELATKENDWIRINACMPAFEAARKQLSTEFSAYLNNESNG